MTVAFKKEHNTVLLSNLEPRVWTINLDFSVAPVEFHVYGNGCRVHDVSGNKTVSWDNCGNWESFLSFKTDKVLLTAMGGHVCPIYARQIGDTIRISNVASRLMEPNEAIRVDTFILLQNISGVPYPQTNFFKDIQLLEASAEYHFSAHGIKRLRSVLEGGSVVSADEVLDIAIAGWDAHLSSGVDIAVLLSGGYDSRFNLAIACNAARRFGNRVVAFHEHKNANEEAIATSVALAAGVELVVYNRHTFLGADRNVVLDPAFIDLQSGFYRENLIRWHHYLSHIQTLLPGCVIMGLGAEAHKGKFYRQIESFAKDVPKRFGVDEIVIKTIARKLEINNYDQNSQQIFIERLVSQATAFREFTTQIDYIHYQTYIANGYGHRCHDLQQYFSIPFPFLDNSFLAAVFALPAADKENFGIVTRGIERLNSDLAEIPYTSANNKALGPRVRRPVAETLSTVIRQIGPVYYDLFPPRRIGRSEITTIEKDMLRSMQKRSRLTSRLVDKALSGAEKIPFLRLDYLIEACLYFDQLEKQNGVIFTIDGGNE